jgi:hypothetical protein
VHLVALHWRCKRVRGPGGGRGERAGIATDQHSIPETVFFVNSMGLASPVQQKTTQTHAHTHVYTQCHARKSDQSSVIITERYPGRHGTKDQRYQPRARWPVTAHLLESRSRHLSDMAESEPKARTASLTHREPRPPSVTTRTLSAKAVRRSSCMNCVSWEWVRLQKNIYATLNITKH